MSAEQSSQGLEMEYRPWAVFHHGDFNLLLAGGVTMVIASTLTTLISAQWLYEETNSAAQLGLLGAVHLVQMPIALYGGTLADSVDRKKLMALTQSVAFLMLLALTVLAATGQLAPWHIFAVTGVSGVVGMLGGSARPAMLPRVVPRPLLINGVTTQNITFQIAAVGAPFIFWQMFDAFGVTISFGVATGIALAATVMPVMLRASGRPQGGAALAPMKSLREGYVFVMGHQLLPGLFLLDIGVTVVSFYRMLFPVFADHLYGLGATGTGLLSAANSIGAILGSSVVFLTDRFSQKGMLVLFATLVYAVLLFAFGLNTIFLLGLVIVDIEAQDMTMAACADMTSGEAEKAGTAFRSSLGTLLSVVEDDVNVHDESAVLSALARHCHFKRDVEIVNGPLDLASGTTLGGLDILTSADQGDSLADLSCQDGELPKFDSIGGWSCGARATALWCCATGMGQKRGLLVGSSLL